MHVQVLGRTPVVTNSTYPSVHVYALEIRSLSHVPVAAHQHVHRQLERDLFCHLDFKKCIRASENFAPDMHKIM